MDSCILKVTKDMAGICFIHEEHQGSRYVCKLSSVHSQTHFEFMEQTSERLGARHHKGVFWRKG